MEPCRVDGGWTTWNPWSSCSVPCGGGGTQTTTRNCTDPAPAYGGAACSGADEETRSCHSGVCRNIARLGYPTQVDTSPNGSPYNAIDGNPNGRWRSYSVTHTESRGIEAWWALTFPQPMYIDEIHVYGRTDCCISRVDGATLSIDGNIVGTLNHSTGFPNQFTEIRKIGSKIKVTASGAANSTNWLSLAEVLVYGTFDASD